MKFELTRSFRFSAAHRLPEAGEAHPCRDLHGHNFSVEVTIAGVPDPRTGWVIDFGRIRDTVAPIVESLDHRLLNEIPGLENPTSENLARWLWERLRPALPGLSRIGISETPGTVCTYWGDE
jgi:6-pyruvoyltetrahydropterin/6-carboxytetrahydropterin synthase